jgi:Fe2+ transport system protein FeoA
MLSTAQLTEPVTTRKSTNLTTLNHLTPGERGTIENIAASTPSLRRRLLEMGLTRGTAVELIRVAPMGDPIEISVRGYRLSLRREEASSILIRK